MCRTQNWHRLPTAHWAGQKKIHHLLDSKNVANLAGKKISIKFGTLAITSAKFSPSLQGGTIKERKKNYHDMGVIRCFLLHAKPCQRRAGADSDFVISNSRHDVIASIALDHNRILLQVQRHSPAIVEGHQSGQLLGLKWGLSTNQ